MVSNQGMGLLLAASSQKRGYGIAFTVSDLGYRLSSISCYSDFINRTFTPIDSLKLLTPGKPDIRQSQNE